MNKALNTLYNWAYANMECCDEPEFTFFSSICDAVAKYKSEVTRLEFVRKHGAPNYDDNIEF